MKISTKIRYGVRAMVELASGYGKGPIELKEIARREEISLKYLEQVFIPLRTAGLVKSIRGSKGGYSLAKSPSEIYLSEIVEVLEGPIEIVDCLRDSKHCRKASHCVTREVWREVSQAIQNILSSITLEELLNRKREKEEIVTPLYQI
jgi:Rrf2 family protein